MFIVYTKPNCHFCVKAKNLLITRGLEFQEFQVNDDNRENLVYYSQNHGTVPLIFKNTVSKEAFLGGYTELKELLDVSSESQEEQ